MRNAPVAEAMEEAWEFEVPASMIDVVFLLLIFFMLSTRFRAAERRLDADLPHHGPNPVQTRVIPPDELRVRIYWADQSGGVVKGPRECAGAAVRIDLGRKPVRDLNELARALAERRRAGGETTIVIDARRSVPFRWVAGALDACRRAGLARVSFQAPAPEGTGGGDWWRT